MSVRALDERGMASTTVVLLMTPLAILMMLMMFDLVRIHLVRGQLRTAADAGALSAVATATAQPRYVYKSVYDSEGNLITLSAELKGFEQRISDPAVAETAARDVVRKNITGPLQAQCKTGLAELRVSVLPDATDDFKGSIEGGGDEYCVTLESKVKLLLAGPLAKLYGVNDNDAVVKATGTAQAVVPPQGGGS